MPHTERMLWAWVRIAGAVAAASGFIAGLIVNVARARRFGEDLGAVLANYLSFLTIFTTLLVVIVLIVAAVWSLRHPGTSPEPFAIALSMAVVTAPTLLVGAVYNLLLRGLPSEAALTDPPFIFACDRYAIEVLHVVLPLFLVIDLLFAPRRRGLPWWSLTVLVGYPLVWTIYTMVRGELVANPDGSAPWWYPYPFLDPHGDGGYGSVMLYIGGITVAFVVIGSLIIAIGRFRHRRALRRAGAAAAVDATAA
ncbi:hypothetical protein GCM10017607_26680 [Microbacterium thalassium]|nr:hypothetical protein GCM10017607_26680 [Microbacterium thalassium]